MSLSRRLKKLEESSPAGRRVFVRRADGTIRESGTEERYTRDELDALSAAGWEVLLIRIVRKPMEAACG